MRSDTGPTGFLVVDKPAGITSHDVVDRIRRIYRTRRVGHTGTLDPDATGVLVMCLGIATRLAEYLSASSKHYQAQFIFGISTDSMDASGSTIQEAEASHLDANVIADLLPAFRGKILQVPPMVSARKHEGRRLYALAREGLTVDREAREVAISMFEMTEFRSGQHPVGEFEITCSSGTYIRVLAADLGAAAGVGAHMRALRRTWVGSSLESAFTLEDAVSLAELEQSAGPGDPFSRLISLADGLRGMKRVRVSHEDAHRLTKGQSVLVAASGIAAADEQSSADPLVALDESGDVIAIVRQVDNALRPVKVFAPQ